MNNKTRYFRSPSWGPSTVYRFIQFNPDGTKNTVLKDGTLLYANWNLAETEQWVKDGSAEELFFIAGDKVRWTCGTASGEGTVLKDGLRLGKYIDVAYFLLGTPVSGYFLLNQLVVSSDPKQEPKATKVRWFVAASQFNDAPLLNHIVFNGEKGQWVHKDGKIQPMTSDWPLSFYASRPERFTEVFAEPPIEPAFKPQFYDKPIPYGYRALKKGEKRRTNGDDSRWSSLVRDFIRCDDDVVYAENCNLTVRKVTAKTDEQLAADAAAAAAAEAKRPKVYALNGLDVFYTVTDANTAETNSRSKRYASEQEALAEATKRVERNVPRFDQGVYVMKAVKLVKPSK